MLMRTVQANLNTMCSGTGWLLWPSQTLLPSTYQVVWSATFCQLSVCDNVISNTGKSAVRWYFSEGPSVSFVFILTGNETKCGWCDLVFLVCGEKHVNNSLTGLAFVVDVLRWKWRGEARGAVRKYKCCRLKGSVWLFVCTPMWMSLILLEQQYLRLKSSSS